jgi:hypothetical protein
MGGDNIKTDVTKECMDWFHLVQGGAERRTVVYRVLQKHLKVFEI